MVGDTVGEVPDHFSHFSHDVTDDKHQPRRRQPVLFFGKNLCLFLDWWCPEGRPRVEEVRSVRLPCYQRRLLGATVVIKVVQVATAHYRSVHAVKVQFTLTDIRRPHEQVNHRASAKQVTGRHWGSRYPSCGSANLATTRNAISLCEDG